MLNINKIKLGQKFKDFLKVNDYRIMVLEGTTMCGKTTVGAGIKFILDVLASKNKIHLISAYTPELISSGVLQSDIGVLHLWEEYITQCGVNKEYNFPHLKLTFPGQPEKIIRLVGSGDGKAFTRIRSNQYGVVYVDEANFSDIQFIQEASQRCEKMIMTLNPDDNIKPLYKQYINKCRPIEKYKEDIPDDTYNKLMEEEAEEGYVYWFFHFSDNVGIPQEVIHNRIRTLVPGTPQHASKVLGLRVIAEGLIYQDYMSKDNIITYQEATKLNYELFTIGIDEGVRDLTVITLIGYTTDYDNVIAIDKVETNQVGPDEIYKLIQTAMKQWTRDFSVSLFYGFFVDNAAPVLHKFLNPRTKADYNLQTVEAYKYKIQERVDIGIRMLYDNTLKFTDKTIETYQALERVMYTDDREKTDCRVFTNHDYKDRIDSLEYGWSPMTDRILQTLNSPIKKSRVGGATALLIE